MYHDQSVSCWLHTKITTLLHLHSLSFAVILQHAQKYAGAIVTVVFIKITFSKEEEISNKKLY